jgi:hypothetical protein
LKALLRSWRLLILVWSVLLAPQVTLVHALSHLASHEAPGKERHTGGDKVCDNCLALAQLGAALPSRFEWTALPHALPERAAPIAIAPSLQPVRAFCARGPPLVTLI